MGMFVNNEHHQITQPVVRSLIMNNSGLILLDYCSNLGDKIFQFRSVFSQIHQTLWRLFRQKYDAGYIGINIINFLH